MTALLRGARHAWRKLKRAQILLAADAGASDAQIERSVGAGGSTVYRTKRRFVEGNLEAALSEQPRSGAERKLTGKEEALLVATACADPPLGAGRAAAAAPFPLARRHPMPPRSPAIRLFNFLVFAARSLSSQAPPGRPAALNPFSLFGRR